MIIFNDNQVLFNSKLLSTEEELLATMLFFFSGQLVDGKSLIDGKSFCEIPIKSKEKLYEQIIEMEINNDYATGNWLGY